MSRYFMIQSWVGSHENEPDYNGQQAGERNVRSSEVVPLYDQFGNANVSAFSDEAIAARSGKATQKKAIPLKNKVIPQLTRYNNLTEQMKEIVAQYNAKEIDIKEYTMLMDITVAKRDRAKILLDKAMLLKPVRGDDAEPLKASVKLSTTTAVMSSQIKQKACQVWTEARMFLVGSVAACAGLVWLAN